MYSLGATLYHAVTGTTPFAAATAAQMRMQHVHAPAPAAHLAAPGLGLAASGLIARLLAKNPDERFAGYDDRTRALDQLLAP